jgi:hypothetical protein
VGAQRVIERERRWATPAAIAAVVTAVLFVASIVIQQTAGISTSSSDAVVERSLHDHSAALFLTSVVRSISFLLLPWPLLYLFRAAQARNPRVQSTMVAFVFIGPILFAAQGIVSAIGQNQAASDYVRVAPTEQVRAYPMFKKQLKQDPGSLDRVTIYSADDSHQLEVQETGGTFYKVDQYPTGTESALSGELDQAQVDSETDSDTGSQAGDAFARHVVDDNGTVKVAAAVALPALLGLVIMMVYVPLQAQRVGLLTRFFGSLGIAFGAALVLIPPALIGVMVWIGYLGLVFVGRVPGGRPPAWDAGEAVPWPRPGEDSSAPAGGGGAIEGQASEVSEGEPSPATGESPERRKRKRRT